MAPEGKRRVGRGGALPKNVKSMSKEVLEATLKKKKECNARALEVVERLLEADVAEEAFLGCLPLIQESHFRDVVEERAISALCGYPLCSAPLDLRTAPERKYTINTRLNKVYDITERKNFCSNLCYKSARFVKDQLLTSPLWLRDGEEVPTFTLLPSFASGGPAGEEVDIGKVPSLKEEVEKLKRDGGKSSLRGKKATSQCLVVEEEGERKVVEPAVESGRGEGDRLSPGNSALAKSENVSVVPDLRSGSATAESIPNESDESSAVTTSEEVTHEAVATVGLLPESVAADRVNGEAGEKSTLAASGEVANEKATMGRIENKVKEVCQVSQLVQTWEGEVHVRGSHSSVCQSDILVRAEATVRPSAKPRPKEGESKVPTKSTVARVESCLEEWVTMETLVLLLGEDAVREAVTTTGTDLKELLLLKSEDGAWDAATRETYRNICRRLNLMELEDARYDTAVAREGRELRPLPDYAAVREESLRMQLKVRAFLGGRTGYEVPPPVEGEGGEEEGTCFLPLVDRHAKGALRRRMVLDRLSRVIPSLTQVLRLSCRDVTSDLRAVVSTFVLEAHNITFKPPEWNLLGLVLLKMISLKNSEIGSALESETARCHAAGILAVFGQREGYLDGLVAQLVDVQKVLGKRARPSGGGDS